MRRNIWEGLSVSAIGVLIWLLTFLYKKVVRPPTTSTSNRLRRGGDAAAGGGGGAETIDSFFSFLKSFANRGGLRHVFPGDDTRDTSVQFELISQVNCTTSVGKPISVTVRNTPQDRRRMRMFGSYNDYQTY